MRKLLTISLALALTLSAVMPLVRCEITGAVALSGACTTCNSAIEATGSERAPSCGSCCAATRGSSNAPPSLAERSASVVAPRSSRCADGCCSRYSFEGLRPDPSASRTVELAGEPIGEVACPFDAVVDTPAADRCAPTGTPPPHGRHPPGCRLHLALGVLLL